MKKKMYPLFAAAVLLCCSGCATGAVTGDIHIEAENFSSEEGGEAVIRTDKQGTCGKSISHWDDKWHIIHYHFNAPAAGNYRLVLRGASVGTSLRRLLVNGREYGPFEVPATGGNGNSPQQWKCVTPLCGGKPVVFALEKGKNTLSLENMDGNPLNLDCILLRRAD